VLLWFVKITGDVVKITGDVQATEIKTLEASIKKSLVLNSVDNCYPCIVVLC